MLGNELGGFDGSLLGDELSEVEVSLGAADLVGGELGLTLGAAARVGCDDGSSFGAMVSSNEPAALGPVLGINERLGWTDG
jgi:hypothetical protein